MSFGGSWVVSEGAVLPEPGVSARPHPHTCECKDFHPSTFPNYPWEDALRSLFTAFHASQVRIKSKLPLPTVSRNSLRDTVGTRFIASAYQFHQPPTFPYHPTHLAFCLRSHQWGKCLAPLTPTKCLNPPRRPILRHLMLSFLLHLSCLEVPDAAQSSFPFLRFFVCPHLRKRWPPSPFRVMKGALRWVLNADAVS